MLHFLPDNLKRFRSIQLLIFLNFALQGLIISPLMLLSYLLFYKTNKKFYRFLINRLCYILWNQFTYIVQWWNKLRIRVYSDKETWDKFGKEHSLVIMNHKYDIDWLATWILTECSGNLGGGVSVAKHSLKYVPFMGWAGIFNGSLFLHRNFEKDKKIIADQLSDFSETYDGYYNTLLLYPEGTRYTDEKRDASNEIARSKHMPELKHCLLPRSKGFIELVRHLSPQIDAIYDLTIGFPDSIVDTNEVNPAKKQPPFTLNNVLKCKIKQGNFYMRRFPMKDLPKDDEQVAEWLQKHFREKDKIFEGFVNSGKFPGPSNMLKPLLSTPIIYCTSFLLVWIPLFYFLGNVVIFGSWCGRLGLMVMVLIFALLMHFMKNMTKTEKGSAYGSKKSK